MGLTALMAQVVLTRELLGLFYGNELSIALVLAVWLVAVAAGSAVGARFGQRLHTPERAFGWSQAAMAGLLPVSLALARRVQPGSPAPGQVLGPGAMLLASLETLAPVCLLAGVQFVLAARAAADQRRTSAASAVSGVAAVYALEAAGAVIGGVVFPVWFAQHAGPFFTLSALGLLNLASAALLLRSSLSRAGLRSLAPVCLLAAALLALGATAGRVEMATLRASPRWANLNPVAVASSRYGALVVARQAGQVAFFQSGVLLFTSQDDYANEVAVHLPMLEHADPRRVLIIGGNIAGLAGEALKHPISRLDCVELDPRVVQLARQWLPSPSLRPLQDARVHLHIGDARPFVRAAEGRYDVIIVNLPDPTTAALNRFYTADFFQQAKRALTASGLLAIGLTGSEAQLTGAVQLAAATTDHTLAAVWPDRVIVPGERMLFLAAAHPDALTSDWRALSQRLAGRRLQTSFVNQAWLQDALLPLHAGLARAAIAQVGDLRLNTDLNPVSYYHQTRIWLDQLSPGVSRSLRWLSHLSVWWALAWFALAALLVTLTRGRVRKAAAILFATAAIGGFGLITEVLALLAFQSACGYLYQALAILMAAFMAGLAAGAAVLGRHSADRVACSRLLAMILAAAAGLCLALPWVFRALLRAPGLAGTGLGLILMLAGFLVGAAFPLLTALYGREQQAARAGGAIYAADLIGSAGAALVAGVAAVPLLGVAGVSYATAMWLAAALALIAVSLQR